MKIKVINPNTSVEMTRGIGGRQFRGPAGHGDCRGQPRVRASIN